MSSLRVIVGFGLSVKAADWIKESGFMVVFGIYVGLFCATSLLGIPIFFYGKRIRAWAGGFIGTRDEGSHSDSERNEAEMELREHRNASSSTQLGDGDSSRDRTKSLGHGDRTIEA
jgi:hypothetical protein